MYDVKKSFLMLVVLGFVQFWNHKLVTEHNSEKFIDIMPLKEIHLRSDFQEGPKKHGIGDQ